MTDSVHFYSGRQGLCNSSSASFPVLCDQERDLQCIHSMHSYIQVCTGELTPTQIQTHIHCPILWRASQPRRVPPEDATAPFPPLHTLLCVCTYCTYILTVRTSCQALSPCLPPGLAPEIETRIPPPQAILCEPSWERNSEDRPHLSFISNILPLMYAFADSSWDLIQEGISGEPRLRLLTEQQPDSSRGIWPSRAIRRPIVWPLHVPCYPSRSALPPLPSLFILTHPQRLKFP